MNTANIALYYPSMEIPDTTWLKGMLLFWDGIRRIVPASYSPNDGVEIKQFTDAGLVKSIQADREFFERWSIVGYFAQV